ncbi:hypothetical protein ElyMa_006618300 [Elysia marginata]|uniref:Uncharacterized protein n=1 Tax=Elysia marginata TaxID=1093978 RepID=A0AAV4IGG8_9GAST|nr:hypothetical protein ElyMa_006618300 [Elysia marginata]
MPVRVAPTSITCHHDISCAVSSLIMTHPWFPRQTVNLVKSSEPLPHAGFVRNRVWLTHGIDFLKTKRRVSKVTVPAAVFARGTRDPSLMPSSKLGCVQSHVISAQLLCSWQKTIVYS